MSKKAAASLKDVDAKTRMQQISAATVRDVYGGAKLAAQVAEICEAEPVFFNKLTAACTKEKARRIEHVRRSGTTGRIITIINNHGKPVRYAYDKGVMMEIERARRKARRVVPLKHKPRHKTA